jgi:cytochrome c oxidase subunit 3
MAHVSDPAISSELVHHVTPAAHTHVQHPPDPPVTPGKVAMWLFLATEIMFFTGLIGSYIVLRAGSPVTAYSNLFSPGTNLERLTNAKGVTLTSVGPNRSRVIEILERTAGLSEHDAEHLIESLPHGVVYGVPPEKAEKIKRQLVTAKAEAKINDLRTESWPQPYDSATNPLSIDLTAANTFILICSSVTMVLALSAFQNDNRRKGTLFLLATVLIGSTFLGVQVFEYYQLMFGHHYPPGISATGHFRPDVSLFASCFFTMTGFHGAHVFGGVVMLTCITIRSALTGAYHRTHYSPVELIGLYWHFVDLVWIILFTVVYLI